MPTADYLSLVFRCPRVDNFRVIPISRNLLVVLMTAFAVAVLSACSGASSPTATVTAPTAVPTSTVGVSPIAPVFSVSTIDGETIRLEDLLGSVPVYLVFIPTSDDPLDRDQMRRIQSSISSFEELNAEVVVVVSDLPTQVIDMRDELGINFPLIADPLDVVASDWQVLDIDNTGSSNPASFVFDAHGNLAARLIASVPEDRPSVNEVLFVIEESLSKGSA